MPGFSNLFLTRSFSFFALTAQPSSQPLPVHPPVNIAPGSRAVFLHELTNTATFDFPCSHPCRGLGLPDWWDLYTKLSSAWKDAELPYVCSTTLPSLLQDHIGVHALSLATTSDISQADISWVVSRLAAGKKLDRRVLSPRDAIVGFSRRSLEATSSLSVLGKTETRPHPTPC